jgi:AAA ATPase domain
MSSGPEVRTICNPTSPLDSGPVPAIGALAAPLPEDVHELELRGEHRAADHVIARYKAASVGNRLALLADATSAIPTVRGRDSELAVFGVHLERARSGVGSVVLVEGAPGMGKSRLLAEAARIAGRVSIRVGSGAAEPVDAVELAPLMAALFEGPEPLLDHEDLHARHALPADRYTGGAPAHHANERSLTETLTHRSFTRCRRQPPRSRCSLGATAAG